MSRGQEGGVTLCAVGTNPADGVVTMRSEPVFIVKAAEPTHVNVMNVQWWVSDWTRTAHGRRKKRRDPITHIK